MAQGVASGVSGVGGVMISDASGVMISDDLIETEKILSSLQIPSSGVMYGFPNHNVVGLSFPIDSCPTNVPSRYT